MKQHDNYGRSESQSRRNEVITMISFAGGVFILLVMLLYNLIN